MFTIITGNLCVIHIFNSHLARYISRIVTPLNRIEKRSKPAYSEKQLWIAYQKLPVRNSLDTHISNWKIGEEGKLLENENRYLNNLCTQTSLVSLQNRPHTDFRHISRVEQVFSPFCQLILPKASLLEIKDYNEIYGGIKKIFQVFFSIGCFRCWFNFCAEEKMQFREEYKRPEQFVGGLINVIFHATELTWFYNNLFCCFWKSSFWLQLVFILR